MRFADFMKEGKVRKGMPDLSTAKALVKTSTNHLSFLENRHIDAISAASILVMYYEALREIVEAICLTEGFKVYSHEAFTSFLQEKNEREIALLFDKYRKLRNAVNYYGESIDIAETEQARTDITKLIAALKQKFKL